MYTIIGDDSNRIIMLVTCLVKLSKISPDIYHAEKLQYDDAIGLNEDQCINRNPDQPGHGPSV
jgi:hypothetical protein